MEQSPHLPSQNSLMAAWLADGTVVRIFASKYS